MNDLLTQFDRLVSEARESLQRARQCAMFDPSAGSRHTEVAVCEAVLMERESFRDTLRLEVERIAAADPRRDPQALSYCMACGDRGGWYEPDEGTWVGCRSCTDTDRAQRSEARARVGVVLVTHGPPPQFARLI